jgi:DNA-directed RNA polymerase specialized sigma24 family protein
MNFPQTRHTLIQRLVARNDESDWRAFLGDYWAPLCRFAMRTGRLSWADAEDVAGQTMLAIVQQRLLSRWLTARTAKLRTLLCAVVRNVIANRARVQTGRERLLRDAGAHHADTPGSSLWTTEATADEVDVFYAAWAESLVHRAAESLVSFYHRDGKGDYFRVLFGRVCEGMTNAQVAEALGMTVTQVEHAHKDARQRLADRLRNLVRDQVWRYCPFEEAEGEFAAEWATLGAYLSACGGLESAIRRAYRELAVHEPAHCSPAIQNTIDQIRKMAHDAKRVR